MSRVSFTATCGSLVLLLTVAAAAPALAEPETPLAEDVTSEPPAADPEVAPPEVDVPALPETTKSGVPLPPIAHDPERVYDFDWVQIDSGEWLKGEIGRMHRNKLYFDSDEFDDVDFDWDSLVTLVSKDVVTVRIEDQDAITGRIELRGGVATFYLPGGSVRRVEQDKILGMISGEPTELNYWSAGASASISARSGNTDQTDLSLRADLVRQTEWTRWRTTYTGEASTVSGSQTANSHRVPSQFDVYLTRRFFLSTPVFEYFTDEFQNIDSRITGGLGVGYEVIDNSWLYFEVDGGAAYQYTDYVSVLPGDDPRDNDAAIFLKTRVDFDFPYGIEWDNSYSLQLVVTDFDKTSQHAESALSFDIWGPLEIEFAFIFDRIEKPVPDAGGDTPVSNDYRLTAGLGVDF